MKSPRKKARPVSVQDHAVPATRDSPVSRRIDALIGEVVLYPGEDRDLFNQLCQRLWDDLKPSGVVQELLLRQIAELVMEINRHKRFQRNLLDYFAEDGLRDLIRSRERDPYGLESDIDDLRLVFGWRDGDVNVIDEIRDLLREGQSLPEAVETRTLRVHLEEFEKLDHLRVRAEVRLQKAIRFFDERANGQSIPGMLSVPRHE